MWLIFMKFLRIDVCVNMVRDILLKLKIRKTLACRILFYFIFTLYIVIPIKSDTLKENEIKIKGFTDFLYEGKVNSNRRPCYDCQTSCMVTCINEKEPTVGEMEFDCSLLQIYELEFNDSECLSAGEFSGFSIKCLNLDDPTVTVDENVFDGVVALSEFHVQRSNIKIIPDFKIVKDSITGIHIHKSPLTSLEGENLQNLTLAAYLYFSSNSIRFIDPHVFKGTENVMELNLSDNLLTVIPPNLLDNMKSLITLLIAANNLLHLENLFTITNPQNIYLFSNNITDVDYVLNFGMKNVVVLDLSDNPIRSLTVNSFVDKIPFVEELYLDHCQIETFNSEYFTFLSELSILDLSNNFIEEDYDEFSVNFALTYDFDLVLELKSLNLNRNKLKSLNQILKHKEIEQVKVAENQVQYLTDEDFRFTYRIKHLELQGNQIRRIDTDTFKPIRIHLKYLDLSCNSITSLNRSMRYLSQLTILNLSHNSIESFARDEFAGVIELSELYLQHNRIKTLWQFQQFTKLKYLNITHNQIQSITPDQVPKTLESMDLAGNILKCDCRLLPFALQQITNRSIKTDVALCLESDPGNKINKNSSEVCSFICTNNEDDYFISVECISKNLTDVPHFLRNNFIQMKDNVTFSFNDQNPLIMKQNMYSSLSIRDQVLGINLENNSLESLQEAQLPPKLIQLFLSNNKLRFLPDSIVDNQTNLKHMSLSGNPWICDCNDLKFKKFKNWLISNRENIHDIENVSCGFNDENQSSLRGKIILTDDLCFVESTGVGLVVSISLGMLGFATFCLVAKLLYTKYDITIKVFLYSHGFTFVKEKDLDCNKTFDAFISFSHEDGEFVSKEIISGVEEKAPNIRLCIHYRHFRAGELIYKNIIQAVQNSKRTVLILSKNFLQSEWCLVEFRTAHLQAMEDKIPRVIVVKFGDLPKEIDPEIRAYLDSTTYLTWGEKNFWNKLLYVLPTSGNARNP